MLTITTPPLLLYGTGGMGREALWTVKAANEAAGSAPLYHPVGFIDDALADGETATLHDLPVRSFAASLAAGPGEIMVSLFGPDLRRRIVARVEAAGRTVASVIHPTAEIGPNVTLGAGTFIGAQTLVSTDARIGRHVYILYQCMIPHDSVIGDYVSICPHVFLGGNVTIGDGAFIGGGVRVKQGVTIGAGAVIGMGAVVMRDVPAGETWAGIPATRLHKRGLAADEIHDMDTSALAGSLH